MPDFSIRSYKKELLDRDDIPFPDIKRNMDELNVINTWLGGHAITLSGFKALAGTRQQLTVCEIGSGGGDNLAAIEHYCHKRNVNVSFTGIDINPFCTEAAKQRLTGVPVQLITADYRQVIPEKKPDIIFSSLFCHHFTDEELVTQLQWMHTHSQTGFFINDLHRHPVAYYAIKGLTGLLSKSYLVKNDAPLSVARGFSKKEWLQLFDKAGISTFSVQWKWAWRWLVVVKK